MKCRQKWIRPALLIVLAMTFIGGCLSVKTEHEIKPIHITMDINLKIQKDLEDFLNLN